MIQSLKRLSQIKCNSLIDEEEQIVVEEDIEVDQGRNIIKCGAVEIKMLC